MLTKNGKSFCYECLDDVCFNIQSEERIGIIKNEEYPYIRKVARCMHCNEELDVYNDENLKLLYDSYRKINNIISLENIREIPEIYNIGKGVLSSLLGWGVHTFNRYYEGFIPTKQYSDVLIKIYTDPLEYRSVLENRKHCISIVAYNKSNFALQKLLFAEPTPIMKVAAYLCKYKEDLSSLRQQKLLYYTQAFSAIFCSSPIFSDPCEAWANGPVYRDVYQKHKIGSIDEEFADLLSDNDRKTINCVLECFGRYDGDTLKEITHLETPWIKARGNLPPAAPSENIILFKSIIDYFSDIRNIYNMNSMNDMHKYAQDMFQRVSNI